MILITKQRWEETQLFWDSDLPSKYQLVRKFSVWFRIEHYKLPQITSALTTVLLAVSHEQFFLQLILLTPFLSLSFSLILCLYEDFKISLATCTDEVRSLHHPCTSLIVCVVVTPFIILSLFLSMMSLFIYFLFLIHHLFLSKNPSSFKSPQSLNLSCQRGWFWPSYPRAGHHLVHSMLPM